MYIYFFIDFATINDDMLCCLDSRNDANETIRLANFWELAFFFFNRIFYWPDINQLIYSVNYSVSNATI